MVVNGMEWIDLVIQIHSFYNQQSEVDSSLSSEDRSDCKWRTGGECCFFPSTIGFS